MTRRWRQKIGRKPLKMSRTGKNKYVSVGRVWRVFTQKGIKKDSQSVRLYGAEETGRGLRRNDAASERSGLRQAKRHPA